MTEYHKINGVFKRGEKGDFIHGDWALPEFDALQECKWDWREKVDGTNIRIYWDGQGIEIKGRTDRAQLPALLAEYLAEAFTNNLERKAWLAEKFPGGVVLYGEGFGYKIQGVGSGYLPDSVSFALFDIAYAKGWIRDEAVESIARELGITYAPVVWRGVTLAEAITRIKSSATSPPVSPLALNGALSEGVVGTPVGGFLNHKGQRIITKLKYKDFR